jgi:hypothetical protein
MSFNPEPWFYSSWQGAVTIAQQQRLSRMRPAVRVENTTGEVHFFERLESDTVSEVATRHADTPNIEADHTIRSCRPRFFVWSRIIDDEDKVRLLMDPTSVYNENAGMSFERKVDLILLQAALGTAYTGKGGTTATTFPAAYQIANGSTGLTKAKLFTASELLLAAENEGPFYMAISAKENTDLLNIPEVASGDFNNAKPLVEGKVQHYMGFNFIHSEQLAAASATVHSCVAWSKNSLGLGVWNDKEMNIAKDPTKNYNWRPHIKYFIGATRLDEVGVVEVATYHA